MISKEPDTWLLGMLLITLLLVLGIVWAVLSSKQAPKDSQTLNTASQEARQAPTLEDKKRELLVEEIIWRESGGNARICNLDYGCRSGMGLMGIISGTWNATLRRMSLAHAKMPQRCWQLVYLPMSTRRTEPIFDPKCNRLVGTWLLVTDGIGHWEGDGTWGSGPYDLTDLTLKDIL